MTRAEQDPTVPDEPMLSERQFLDELPQAANVTPEDAWPRYRAVVPPAGRPRGRLMAAHCPSCGGKFSRAKREDGSWHPPLEFRQVALVTGRDDGVVRQELVWQQHACLDVRVDPFQAAGSKQKTEHQAARGRAHRLAVSVPCPTCAAQIGKQCINLTRRKPGLMSRP